MPKLIVLDLIMVSEGITRKDIQEMKKDIAESWLRRHNVETINVILGSSMIRRSGEDHSGDHKQMYTF